jgi:hypothetical protein
MTVKVPAGSHEYRGLCDCWRLYVKLVKFWARSRLCARRKEPPIRWRFFVLVEDLGNVFMGTTVRLDLTIAAVFQYIGKRKKWYFTVREGAGVFLKKEVIPRCRNYLRSVRCARVCLLC